MAVDGEEVHIDTDEARGGSTPNRVRWILGISLLGAIVLLSAVWIFGAASSSGSADQATVSGMIDEGQDTSGTDGMVSDEFAAPADTSTDPLNMPNEAGAAEANQAEPAQ